MHIGWPISFILCWKPIQSQETLRVKDPWYIPGQKAFRLTSNFWASGYSGLNICWETNLPNETLGDQNIAYFWVVSRCPPHLKYLYAPMGVGVQTYPSIFRVCLDASSLIFVENPFRTHKTLWVSNTSWCPWPGMSGHLISWFLVYKVMTKKV